jgi:hypothetical protein
MYERYCIIVDTIVLDIPDTHVVDLYRDGTRVRTPSLGRSSSLSG